MTHTPDDLMKKKLTLRLNASAIRKAKSYARARGISVSQLVENHFVLLEAAEHHRSPVEETSLPAPEDVPPLIQAMRGVARGPAKEGDYYAHLEAKHG